MIVDNHIELVCIVREDCKGNGEIAGEEEKSIEGEEDVGRLGGARCV